MRTSTSILLLPRLPADYPHSQRDSKIVSCRLYGKLVPVGALVGSSINITIAHDQLPGIHRVSVGVYSINITIAHDQLPGIHRGSVVVSSINITITHDQLLCIHRGSVVGSSTNITITHDQLPGIYRGSEDHIK